MIPIHISNTLCFVFFLAGFYIARRTDTRSDEEKAKLFGGFPAIIYGWALLGLASVMVHNLYP